MKKLMRKALLPIASVAALLLICDSNYITAEAEGFSISSNELITRLNDEVIVNKEICPNLSETGFEDGIVGEGYTREYWEYSGFNPSNWDNGLATRTKVTTEEAYTGFNSLEVFYPEGAYGSEGTGTQVELNLDPQDEYYMSYRIKFDENFSWGSETTKGGKLPGITGGERCGSDFSCDGTDGFSSRFMWRSTGDAYLYLYSADMQNEQYGDEIPFQLNGDQFTFETNKWYTITERVKLNTTETSDDGIVEVWVNGEQVINLDDITFVTNDQQIDTFYFSTFHGGNSEAWAPQNDSYAYYDDLKVSTCPDGVDFE